MSILATIALAAALTDCANYSSSGFRSYSRPSVPYYSRPIRPYYSRPIRRPEPSKQRAYTEPSAPRSGFRDTDPNTGNPQYMIYPWWLFMLNNHPLPECSDEHPNKCRLPKPADKVK